MQPLRFGSLTVDPPLVLAPMAGVTDRQFRLVLKRLGGIGLLSMEFVSSEGMVRGNRRTLELMQYSGEEHPLSIQIYGADPDRMAKAAILVEEAGADACDINMGCPANKIRKGRAGCALMGDLDLARRIIASVRKAIRIPLTVKFRAGLRENDLTFLELGRICQEEGADAVTLHPRTAKQMFSGRADWSRIARLKEAVSIPVVGNGDVAAATDALRMFRETGCDGVMIGRASMKNPWIYRQTAALAGGEEPVEPTLEERRRLILGHYRLILEQEDRRLALHKMRTFTGWYTHGIPGGRKLRLRIGGISTVEEFLREVESFFADPEKGELPSTRSEFPPSDPCVSLPCR
jgi:nifR3 family TIM-barrel protein